MTQDDRGMRAVLRARSVRERDSRVGLLQARAEEALHAARAAHLAARIADAADVADGGDGGSSRDFLAARDHLLALGDAATAARSELASAHRIAESAQAHWQGDRIRVRAVESLLERRAQARRDERARREALALDDVAAQGWARRRTQ